MDSPMPLDWTAIFTLILAIATVVLAFFNWRIIKQTSDIRQKERKERLLKEIIDWGESIRRCSYMPHLEEMVVVLKLTGDDKRRVLALKYGNEYGIVAIKYTYLKNIASELDDSVQSAMKTVSDDLRRHIILLDQEYAGKTKGSDVPNSIDTLKESVNKMIEVATGLLPE
jgi:hypothetical protein